MKICIAEQCPVDLWTVRQFIIALTAFFGRAIRTPRLLPFLLVCPDTSRQTCRLRSLFLRPRSPAGLRARGSSLLERTGRR